MDCRLVLPVIVTYGADFLISVIQLMFVGHMGSTEMAGVALAASFCNVTGYSVVIGLLSAMDTLIAQAFGAQKPEQIGVTVQQSLVVIVLYTFLILPVWFVRLFLSSFHLVPLAHDINFLFYSLPPLFLPY